MTSTDAKSTTSRPAGPHPLRQAVCASFTASPSAIVESFARFSEGQWRRNLRWLDTSGFALYLLDHLTSLKLERTLPPSIFARLKQNLADNRVRNADLLAQACEINHAFTRQGILYANLKGITLSPAAVPDPALRYQLDLDFLVYEEHAEQARAVLEAQGYVLDAISGATWEFKAGQFKVASIRDLYKPKTQRSAELHLAPAGGVLDRLHSLTYSGTSFPALSPPDLYLLQASHLAKHIRSSFTRAAWLLEYRRHMLTRREDQGFWLSLARLATSHDERLALALSTGLIVELFGDRPSEALATITAGQLSPSSQLWIKLYGRHVPLASYPGTKLHLLLESSLQPVAVRPKLLPRTSPPMITQPSPDKSLRLQLHRYRMQIYYFLFQLRFHAFEGLRYHIESSRFHRRLTGLAH
jgi:hypothetical protein